MIKLPTGFGKSFIAFLLALYYRRHGLVFAIVSTDNFLVQQMARQLGKARQSFHILTVYEAYKRHAEFDGFIVDEADRCIFDMGCAVD